MRPGLAPILFGRPGRALPGAVLDLDFANRWYFGGPETSALSISRASSGTDLLPTSESGASYNTFASGVLRITSLLGLLIEEARTNVLLNSTVPATQTTASLATGTYTLWVNGAGSATSSAGTATITGNGAATNGTPNVFVVTVAGTVTITVAGALNAFQCELGAFGTSLIVTAGASATRAADVPSLIGPAATAALAAKAAFFQTTALAGGVSPKLLIFNGDNPFAGLPSTSSVQIGSGASNATAGFGSGTTASVAKIAIGFDSNSMTAIANSGTKATTTNPWTAGTTIYLGNRFAGDRAINGYLQRFALSLTKGAFDAFTA